MVFWPIRARPRSYLYFNDKSNQYALLLDDFISHYFIFVFRRSVEAPCLKFCKCYKQNIVNFDLFYSLIYTVGKQSKPFILSWTLDSLNVFIIKSQPLYLQGRTLIQKGWSFLLCLLQVKKAVLVPRSGCSGSQNLFFFLTHSRSFCVPF